MSKIKKHPVLEVPVRDRVIFKYNGQEVEGEKGYTIAAALHRAGFPVHSHSLDGRERSLECGIGKCGACEMLVDGKIRRICITKVDDGVADYPLNWVKTRLYCDQFVTIFLFSDKWSQNHR